MIKRVIMGCLLVLGLGALFALRDKTPSLEVVSAEQKDMEDDVESGVKNSKASVINLQKHASSEFLKEAPRDDKVTKGLQRFIDKTATITEESLAQEQKKIAEGLRLALQKPTPEPQTTALSDDDGERWDVLDFGDGIVRYVPSVED